MADIFSIGPVTDLVFTGERTYKITVEAQQDVAGFGGLRPVPRFLELSVSCKLSEEEFHELVAFFGRKGITFTNDGADGSPTSHRLSGQVRDNDN